MGSYHGHFVFGCDGQTTCGTVNNGMQTNTINTCGGGAAAIQARNLKQLSNCDGVSSNWYRITQFCPDGMGSTWYATKLCPIGSTNTACGSTTQTTACKGCPGYPVGASGTLSSGTYINNPSYPAHNIGGFWINQDYSNFDYNLL
jgi:hypothetical protein